MQPQTVTPSMQPPPGDRSESILQSAVVWHAVVAVAAVILIVVLWLRPSELATWGRIGLTFGLLALGGASAAAVPYLQQRHHRGRLFSLAVNYLGFVVTLVSALHYTGVFLNIDALADSFGRGVPFIGVIVLGFLIDGVSDSPNSIWNVELLGRRLGKVVMLVGAALLLIAVGLIPGLLSWLTRLNTPLNLGLTLSALLFGAGAILMWRSDVARVMGESSIDSETLNGYLFLSPNLLGFLLFFAGPLLFSLYVSFTDSDAFGQSNFIGLANYREIFNLTIEPLVAPDQLANEVLDVSVYGELNRFTLFGRSYIIGAEDKLFWIALGNTLTFVLLAVPLSIIPALLLATVLNSKVPGMNIFRTIYFLPSIAAVVGVALIWRWLYNSTTGWINYAIALGVNGLNRLSGAEVLANPEIGWLSDTDVALLAVVIIAAWQWTGFNTILYLAGLQNIPNSLYEAATVDGAGAVTQFFRITVPLLSSTTFFVVITTTIQAMQIFDQVFVLTNPPGGPGTSTTTIVLYLYNQGFRNFRQGYASALAWVLFLLIFGLTLLQFQRNRRDPATA